MSELTLPTVSQLLIKCGSSIDQDVDRVPIEMLFEGLKRGYLSTLEAFSTRDPGSLNVHSDKISNFYM